jgi:hypothetical protein
MYKLFVILLWCDIIFLVEIALEFLLRCNSRKAFNAINWADFKRRIPKKVKMQTVRDLKICLIVAILLEILIVIFKA